MGGQLQIVSSQPLPNLTVKSSVPKQSYWEQVGQGLVQNMKDEGDPEIRKRSGKIALEVAGAEFGGEAVPVLRGFVGVLARMLGTGAGAGAGNAAGQLVTSGKVDPIESLKTAGTFSAFQGGSEFLGSLSKLRSSLSRLMYTGEVAADGTPLLSKAGRSILHPTELPENIMRSTIPPPQEAVDAAAKQAGEANAAKMEEQMGEAEKARQKELAANERLKNIDAQSRMNRQRQQDLLDAQAAKNAPETSPFAGATSTTSPIGSLKLPAPGEATATSGTLPQGTTTPFVGKFTPPEASKIVSPLSPPPPINRTLVSYDRNLLVHMARGGDLNALRELIRNPGEIDVANAVPNSKYLMEGNAPTNIYGGPK